MFSSVQSSPVQSLSHVRLFATPWIAARQASLSITNSQSSLKFMYIELVMLSNHLIILPLVFATFRVFSNESALRIRWPKYWSFSFSIIPSKEIPGLISFRIDWLDLLAVQGTLKRITARQSLKPPPTLSVWDYAKGPLLPFSRGSWGQAARDEASCKTAVWAPEARLCPQKLIVFILF